MTSTSLTDRFASLAASQPIEKRNLWKEAFHRLLLNRLATVGLGIVIVFMIAALIGPYGTPYDFLEQDIDHALQNASWDHLLGTDALGRDIFSRLLHGARTAAFVGFLTTGISLALGLMLGGVAGYARGWVDELLMWLTDVTMSVPGLLLAMLMNTALKRPIAA